MGLACTAFSDVIGPSSHVVWQGVGSLSYEDLLADTISDFEQMGFSAEKTIEVLTTTVEGLEYLSTKEAGPSHRDTCD